MSSLSQETSWHGVRSWGCRACHQIKASNRIARRRLQSASRRHWCPAGDWSLLAGLAPQPGDLPGSWEVELPEPYHRAGGGGWGGVEWTEGHVGGRKARDAHIFSLLMLYASLQNILWVLWLFSEFLPHLCYPRLEGVDLLTILSLVVEQP